jgi:hypothetical protein
MIGKGQEVGGLYLSSARYYNSIQHSSNKANVALLINS